MKNFVSIEIYIQIEEKHHYIGIFSEDQDSTHIMITRVRWTNLLFYI